MTVAVRHDGLRRAVGDDAALVHADEPLDRLDEHVDDVLDPDDRDAAVVQRADRRDEALGLGVREAARRSRRGAAPSDRSRARAPARAACGRGGRATRRAGWPSASMPALLERLDAARRRRRRAHGGRPPPRRRTRSRTPSSRRRAAAPGALARSRAGSARRPPGSSRPCRRSARSRRSGETRRRGRSGASSCRRRSARRCRRSRRDAPEVDVVEDDERAEALREPGRGKRRYAVGRAHVSQLRSCTASAWPGSGRACRLRAPS